MLPPLKIEATPAGYTVTRKSGFQFSFLRGGTNSDVSACEVIRYLLSENEKLRQALDLRNDASNYS